MQGVWFLEPLCIGRNFFWKDWGSINRFWAFIFSGSACECFFLFFLPSLSFYNHCLKTLVTILKNVAESSQKKSSGNANSSLVDDHIKGTAEAIEDAEKDRTGGKGDGDAEEGGREEKEATGGKEDGDGEKKTKEEGAKSQPEDEEPDDILETLICSICQDILHKCIR